MNTRVLAALMLGLTGHVAQAQDDYPTVEFGGRLMLDYTVYDDDIAPLDDGGEVRRARLFAAGKLADRWDYKLQLDFAGDDPELKDGYVRYKAGKSRLWLGQFKQPYGLEALTSSKYITFIERSLPTAFIPDRRLGVGWQTGGDNWTALVSAYGDEANSDGTRGKGFGGRLTYVPWQDGNDVLHLGVAAGWAERDGDTLRFRSRPEAHQDSARLVDSGNFAADDFTRVGLEAAMVRGRLSLQGEYMRVDVSRPVGGDVDFSGYYIYASYFLTDDHRPYKQSDGVFNRVKPAEDSGAWELGVRASNINLTDRDVLGGEEDNITLSLSYYATSHLRFSGNLIGVDTDAVAGDDDPNIFVVRMQYDF